MDKISVIIPVYNRTDVLERCVASVRAQHYRELEIILVDDGSTDGSGQLCFDLAATDSRIRAAHIRHGGASAARNTGLMMSSGTCVCFLDSDDVISPKMIARLYDDLQQHDADVASCRFRIEGAQVQLFVPVPGEVTVMTPHEAFGKMLLNDGLCGFGVSPGTKLVRRSLLTEPHPAFFPEGVAFGEDTIWVTQVLARARRVAMDSSVMMRYSYECTNSVCRNANALTRLMHTRWKLNYLREHGYSGEVMDLMQQEESQLTTRLLFDGL